MNGKQWRVTVMRSDHGWLAEVVGLSGGRTYAQTLDKLDQYVREVIVLSAGLPDKAMSGLDIAYEIPTGDRDDRPVGP